MTSLFDRVVSAVCREMGVSRPHLLAATRCNQDVAWARQVAVYCCWKLKPGLSWSELGRWFKRDRTTVRHACRLVEEVRGEGEDLDELVRRIESECSTATV